MELQVGVKILLKNKEGKYLLVRRNPEKYPDVGARWDIVGGRIAAGIPLIDNLRREIREEVALDFTDEPKLVAAQDILPDHKSANGAGPTNGNKHVVRLTYIGKIDGEPRINTENTEAKWFDGEEIRNLQPLDGFFSELIFAGIIKI